MEPSKPPEAAPEVHRILIEAFDDMCRCPMCVQLRYYGRPQIKIRPKETLDKYLEIPDYLVEERVDEDQETRAFGADET